MTSKIKTTLKMKMTVGWYSSWVKFPFKMVSLQPWYSWISWTWWPTAPIDLFESRREPLQIYRQHSSITSARFQGGCSENIKHGINSHWAIHILVKYYVSKWGGWGSQSVMTVLTEGGRWLQNYWKHAAVILKRSLGCFENSPNFW